MGSVLVSRTLLVLAAAKTDPFVAQAVRLVERRIVK